MISTQIKQQLEQLDALMLDTEKKHERLLEKIHPAQYPSAINLLHYLALRSVDIRELQNLLHEVGLSSLANAESHVRSQVLAVLKYFTEHNQQAQNTYSSSKDLLQKRARVLFGELPDPSIPAIMVTLKTSHAQDLLAVKKLLRSGMNIARINCAHDDEKAWLQMVKNVQSASEITGIPCKIYMDLAGPKIRTQIKKRKKDRIMLEEEDVFFLSDNEKFKADLPVVICTIPGIASQLKIGERVLFDDGLFEAKIIDLQPGAAQLEVLRVSAKKPYLKSEKGINFPDSQLSLSALTSFDRKSLPVILQHADMIGYSFIHNIPDLTELQNEMQVTRLPIILKIETPEAFKNLPQLLFKAMEQEYFGVMIARGDLAVEIGFEKMSDVQEEICWLCDAAHAPVIWATQVLETMNKSGLATRSEITDASLGGMAECVMLNKGAHTVQTIKALKTILKQSGDTRHKKRFFLKPLNTAKRFLESTV